MNSNLILEDTVIVEDEICSVFEITKSVLAKGLIENNMV